MRSFVFVSIESLVRRAPKASQVVRCHAWSETQGRLLGAATEAVECALDVSLAHDAVDQGVLTWILEHAQGGEEGE